MNLKYRVNSSADLLVARGNSLEWKSIDDAIHTFNKLIDKLSQFEIDIFPLLGMRNLSAFVGELFAASLIRHSDNLFRKNPHQDGYPDLLLMDGEGSKAWEALVGRQQEKKPFSPFPTGGVEIKATCGSVPTPQQLMKKGLKKPGLGHQRANLLSGYDWKAHHQDTNNMLGIFWDFVDAKPRIVAIFYCNNLNRHDWGKIIQPKEGGGRTTSVSIMTRPGVKKMYENWVAVLNDETYLRFFDRFNKGEVFQQ